MKRLLIFLSVILVLAGIAALIYYYVYVAHRRQNELILYGNVDVRQVNIGFRVAGQVDTLYFEEGDYVKTGQLMATLNRSPYQSEMSQAQSNVDSARANYENSEKLLKRRQELIGIGGVSQEDLEVANTNRDTYRANLAAAVASFEVSKSNLSYTEAFAPTEGVILTRIREPGTVVNPADPVYCTFSVSSPVWIRAFVSGKRSGECLFRNACRCAYRYTRCTDLQRQGWFYFPVSEFTPKTVETTSLRTDLVYRLRIYIDNPDQILKQGMPVTVKLRLRGKAT